MQKDIDAAQPPTPVHILGVNAAGEEADNALVCAGRLLPWLQDTPAQSVWGAWHVTYRDVVILDRENRVLQVYNLTAHNLGDPASYNELRDILLAAAR